LRALADHDPLTGLLNRRGFNERLAAAVASAARRQAPLSVITVDADHFKRVNDMFGHDVGDQVLQSIAGVLSDRLRTSDFVARLGGEEFIVVLPDTAEAGAAQAASALVNAVRAADMPVVGRVTVSCGVAELRLGQESVDEALRRADEALYLAKQGGRNRFHLAMATTPSTAGQATTT
jgi:diguanylate cyclase (GGDEF)-like protein